MKWLPEQILSLLDARCKDFTFPMLDNGYVYLAATRLSLYRLADEWAMVIEVFGFSPRTGTPDVGIHTFDSTLHREKSSEEWAGAGAFEEHRSVDRRNEISYAFPIEEGEWQDADNGELLAEGTHPVSVRGKTFQTPALEEYQKHGISLEHPNHAHVYEFCRWLANVAREDVLATPEERRANVPPELVQILQLEEWNHPDVVRDDSLPSSNETFKQLAEVLVSGDVSLYQPTDPPNTHWSHWPEGGTL